LCLYGPKSAVINLSKENFESEVLYSDHVWVVEFYAPWCGHCKQLAPEYEKLAENLKGIVKIGAINADEAENRDLAGMYGIKGFPTIKIFADKKKPIDYQGQRVASNIAQEALNYLPSFVATLTSKSFDTFLEKASGLAKVILFTDKSATTNLYKAISVEFKGRLAVAQVGKSEKGLVEQFKVTTYPTLLVVKDDLANPIHYNGKLNAADLINFLNPFAKPKPPPKRQQPPKDKSQPPPAAPKEPEIPPELHHVSTQEQFEKVCYNQTGNCVVTFFLPEEEEHEKYLSIYNEVFDNFKKQFHFVWLDGIKQDRLLNYFNLRSGFPATVVINSKKNRFINYIGAFDKEALTTFLKGILNGNKRTIEFKPPVPAVEE